ncbi:hypothetical protein DL96DRAFT_1585979 [Flagelloscypha sp. PMI_526]|nr:hypothetical protein DL96DRAFT_1585979 [Flagelloscypha sp. PMI_526]
MKVFLTGGTGRIGSHIVEHLVAAGHTVTALARSDSSAEKLLSLGATTIVRGSHTDLTVLSQAAAESDAVLHCAFNHDIIFQPNGYAMACEEDRAAITAMCDALVESGTGKTFINSSGTLGNLTEDEMSAKAETQDPAGFRQLSEKLVVSYVDRGVRGINLRLAPVTHGEGSEHPFITNQIQVAKKVGFAGYIGEGSNVWPAAHAKDAAALYVLALTAEKVKPGANLNGIAEEGIPTREIAEFIGRKLGVESKSVPPEEAMNQWGPFSQILGSGGKITNQLTREWTGWTPTGPGLFEAMEDYYTF